MRSAGTFTSTPARSCCSFRMLRESRWPQPRPNASVISSKVRLKDRLSEFGSNEHPLQGQARFLVNTALIYTTPNARMDASVLVGVVGRRLAQLAEGPLGDIYAEPASSLDATVNFQPFGAYRFKFSARNLTDPTIREFY